MNNMRLVCFTVVVICVHFLETLSAENLENVCDKDIPSRPAPRSSKFGISKVVVHLMPKVCTEGEFHDWFECRSCADGTFMTRTMAEAREHVSCQECYQPREDQFEIVVEPCTKTRDSYIMCEDGYYRSVVPGKPCQSQCSRCDVCGLGINMFKNHAGRECSGYQNTVCCPHENMGVENNSCIVKTTATKMATTATTTMTTLETTDTELLPDLPLLDTPSTAPQFIARPKIIILGNLLILAKQAILYRSVQEEKYVML
ncbi:unnamed protein product [Lymnaea stagnalis]|uniref:TNFR-Cys domain-containing protein n=1 Tax=Lymnaea stagnalis TaxID=6523 RepID=A0AAV2HGX5_LYMST